MNKHICIATIDEKYFIYRKHEKVYVKNFKDELKRNHRKIHSQELLNHLFNQPYTKIEFLMNDLNISRITATSYLNQLANGKLVTKHKLEKKHYFVNKDLTELLSSL